ncbi:MAG: prepilin-type N-terminal cleavage/methylation domain-containing protein [Puniceicoccales bacterium]|jgi:prepilin-type N-terminal cleavage/methylation domain-containing protein|nr:prepilin-type N-terminal cleavage/methylation domain-containing protein [Puniceicoccales bacterium]
MDKILRNSRCRPAFTLIELMTVLAIMLLIGSIVFTLKPENPEGIAGAQRIASEAFQIAQMRAVQSPNPDRNPTENPLYNVRTRVLILNDPSIPSQHLRLIRIIVGGTLRLEEGKSVNVRWYASEPDAMLPEGIYMVAPDAKGIRDRRRSIIAPNEGNKNTMRLNIEPTLDAQPDGSGDKEWFFYEFNNDGTSNMKSATLMLAEGEWNPGENNVLFRSDLNVAGFWLAPSGKTVFYTNSDEIDGQ